MATVGHTELQFPHTIQRLRSKDHSDVKDLKLFIVPELMKMQSEGQENEQSKQKMHREVLVDDSDRT